MNEPRIETGIPGLDDILHGGLIPRRSYLLVGATGTGKTVFSLQWLLHGSQNGEQGLYITLAEPAGEIERNVATFGWDLDDLDVLDLTPRITPEDISSNEYQVFPPSEVERVPMWRQIVEAVEDKRPQRVAIDSMTQLHYLATDEYQFRKSVLGLVRFLNDLGCTCVFTFEPTDLERETGVALAVDGVIRLNMQISPQRVIALRSLQVDKLRGSDFMSGRHPLRITDHGMRIFPHVIESAKETTPGTELITSGIAELDALLGGGLESGTTTLVTGPAGVGKSTLAVQFAAQAAADGKRSVIYTFEESTGSMLTRYRGIGLPVDELGDDAVEFRVVNALELYPDEFLQIVRQAVEEERELVVMDGLRGYQLAMEEYGSLVAHIHNLIVYLKSQGVNVFLINELEQVTGELRLTDLGVSYVADNVILLRYVEYAGQIIKVIGCLKKRLGDFQPELRRLTITSDGLQISERLEHLRGVLTGMPDYAAAEDAHTSP